MTSVYRALVAGSWVYIGLSREMARWYHADGALVECALDHPEKAESALSGFPASGRSAFGFNWREWEPAE